MQVMRVALRCAAVTTVTRSGGTRPGRGRFAVDMHMCMHVHASVCMQPVLLRSWSCTAGMRPTQTRVRPPSTQGDVVVSVMGRTPGSV